MFLDLCSEHIPRHAAAAAKSLQSCLTLCDPIDSSPPGSSVPGIVQARTLEWVAIPFSNAWEWKVKVKSPSCVRLFETLWSVAHQAPPPMGFSRQEYWSGLPFLSPIPRHTNGFITLHLDFSLYHSTSLLVVIMNAYPGAQWCLSRVSCWTCCSFSHGFHQQFTPMFHGPPDLMLFHH